MSEEEELKGSDEIEHNVVEKTAKVFGVKKISVVDAPKVSPVEKEVENAYQSVVAEMKTEVSTAEA